MKKFLIATTALIATAGVAAADVTFSGYGRFGADHNGGASAAASATVINNAYNTAATAAAARPGATQASVAAAGTAASTTPAVVAAAATAAANASSTQVNSRMRVNIDGSTETDSGVKFGARVRIQQSTNSTAATLNAAQFYASFAGARMEVGNTNTAIDAVKLMYNSEIGYLDRGFGDPIGGFTAYQSTPYAAAGRMGVFGSYAFGTGNIRASMINPNQTVDASARTAKTEVSISADYQFGQFTVAAAYADNANTVDNNTSLFLGAEYAVMPNANVGLLHFQDKTAATIFGGKSTQKRTTLYGNYTMDAYKFKGYIAHDDAVGNATDTSFGLGMDYAMGGGTRLAADIHRTYAKDTVAGVGVRFDF